ncbi:MAG: alpha/beta hydrolase fold domain-containing protein [Gemmobacter sp.]
MPRSLAAQRRPVQDCARRTAMPDYARLLDAETRADVLSCVEARHGGDEPVVDPTAALLQNTDFAGLPPTVIVTAQCDPLSDDGPAYAARLAAAGGRAVSLEATGLVHGFLRARLTVGRARAAFDRIVDAIAALGRGDWPYGDAP